MSDLFILDCSVAMAWCFEDEKCVYSAKILDEFNDRGALVPWLWNLEITNAVLVGERRKKILHADAARFLDLLDTLNITTSSFIPSREVLWRTAGAYDLTSYDTLYLMLAMRERVPLATKDRALMRACDAVGVELLR
jgi:predicted nucleic acid-binding protein